MQTVRCSLLPALLSACLLVVALSFSGCGPGQAFGPTLTPPATNTPTRRAHPRFRPRTHPRQHPPTHRRPQAHLPLRLPVHRPTRPHSLRHRRRLARQLTLRILLPARSLAPSGMTPTRSWCSFLKRRTVRLRLKSPMTRQLRPQMPPVVLSSVLWLRVSISSLPLTAPIVSNSTILPLIPAWSSIIW